MDTLTTLLRSAPRTDKIQRIVAEITPEDAQKFRIFPDVDATGPGGDDKSQVETDQEIQKSDPQHPGYDGRQIPGTNMTKAQAIDRQRGITRGYGNMADVEPDAEYFPDKPGHAQEKAKADIANQRARMLFYIIRQPA